MIAPGTPMSFYMSWKTNDIPINLSCNLHLALISRQWEGQPGKILPAKHLHVSMLMLAWNRCARCAIWQTVPEHGCTYHQTLDSNRTANRTTMAAATIPRLIFCAISLYTLVIFIYLELYLKFRLFFLSLQLLLKPLLYFIRLAYFYLLCLCWADPVFCIHTVLHCISDPCVNLLDAK